MERSRSVSSSRLAANTSQDRNVLCRWVLVRIAVWCAPVIGRAGAFPVNAASSASLLDSRTGPSLPA